MTETAGACPRCDSASWTVMETGTNVSCAECGYVKGVLMTNPGTFSVNVTEGDARVRDVTLIRNLPDVKIVRIRMKTQMFQVEGMRFGENVVFCPTADLSVDGYHLRLTTVTFDFDRDGAHWYGAVNQFGADVDVVMWKAFTGSVKIWEESETAVQPARHAETAAEKIERIDGGWGQE